MGECLEHYNLRTHGVRGVGFPLCIEPSGGKLTIDMWLGLCTSMLEAVSGLHKRCIVHGDVKLANFCLGDGHAKTGQTVKIIDFGMHR